MSSSPCGVGMPSVAGIHHMDVVAGGVVQVVGDEVGRAADSWRTTNMSACIAHRLSTVSSSVSPLGRGGRDVEVDHVCGKPLGCDLEGRGCGVLEEDVEDALATQQRQLLTSRSATSVKGLGGVEDGRQDALGQTVERAGAAVRRVR